MNNDETDIRARAAYEASQRYYGIKDGPAYDDKSLLAARKLPEASSYCRGWLRVPALPRRRLRSPNHRRRLQGLAPLKSKHSLASPPSVASGSTEVQSVRPDKMHEAGGK